MSTAAEHVARAAWASKASSVESIDLSDEMKNNSPAGDMKSTAVISVELFSFSRSELSVWPLWQEHRAFQQYELKYSNTYSN